MLGDATLFIRGDEAEAAWGAVMPILNAWETTLPREYFPNYEAGTWGPASAERSWKPWREWRQLRANGIAIGNRPSLLHRGYLWLSTVDC